MKYILILFLIAMSGSISAQEYHTLYLKGGTSKVVSLIKETKNSYKIHMDFVKEIKFDKSQVDSLVKFTPVKRYIADKGMNRVYCSCDSTLTLDMIREELHGAGFQMNQKHDDPKSLKTEFKVIRGLGGEDDYTEMRIYVERKGRGFEFSGRRLKSGGVGVSVMGLNSFTYTEVQMGGGKSTMKTELWIALVRFVLNLPCDKIKYLEEKGKDWKD